MRVRRKRSKRLWECLDFVSFGEPVTFRHPIIRHELDGHFVKPSAINGRKSRESQEKATANYTVTL
jgi:hypothetical protein